MPNRVCVCKICHCGKSKCSHKESHRENKRDSSRGLKRESSNLSFGGFEKHHNHVLDIYPPALRKRRKDVEADQPEPMDTCVTTEEFVPFPLPYAPRPAKGKYYPPIQEFQTETEYRYQFIPRPIEPARSTKPEKGYTRSPPFKEESTYQRSFRPFTFAEMLEHRPLAMRPPNLWEGTPEFKDRSNYQEDYLPHVDAKPAAPIYPAKLPPIEGKFYEGQSLYRDSYVPKQTQKLPPIIYKSKSGLLQTDSACELPFPTSTAKRDYISHPEAERPTSMKPPLTPLPFQGEPFAQATSYKDHYYPKEFCEPPEYPSWAPPPSKRDRAQLPPIKDKKCEKQAPYFTFSDDKNFRNTTTFKRSYPAPPIESRPPASYKPIMSYKPTTEAMETKTTFTNDYKGDFFPPAKPFVRRWEAEMQGRFKHLPLSTRTEYRDRFHSQDYWIKRAQDSDSHDDLECCCRYCKCRDVNGNGESGENIITADKIIMNNCGNELQKQRSIGIQPSQTMIQPVC